MKLSKQDLRKIVQEELTNIIEQDELEEGFFDKLLGKSDSSESPSTEQDDVSEFIIDASNALKQLLRVAGGAGARALEREFQEMISRIQDLEEPLKNSVGQKLKPGQFKSGSKTKREPVGYSSRPGMVFEKNKNK